MSKLLLALIPALLTGSALAGDSSGESALAKLRARRAARAGQAAPAPEAPAPAGISATVDRGTVTLSELPTDLASFLSVRDQIATAPEGGVVVFVLAAHLYGRDKKLGMDAFTVAFDRSNLSESPRGYQGFAPANSVKYLIDKLDGRPWVGQTYVGGTTPANGYELPPGPCVFRTFTNQATPIDAETMRLMIHTSGADNPRPFTVRRNDKGIWKIKEGSSMFTDMKKPGHGVPVSDDL